MVSHSQEIRLEAEQSKKNSQSYLEKELSLVEKIKGEGNPIRIKFLTSNANGTDWIWISHKEFLEIKNILKKNTNQ